MSRTGPKGAAGEPSGVPAQACSDAARPRIAAEMPSEVTASPFEVRAATYDETFTRTAIGTRMRRAVWRRLDAAFPPSARLLELGCGTGEDAVHLAARGLTVLATDPAEGMLAEVRAKAGREGVTARVTTRALDAARLSEVDLVGPYDGAFSNFGALNCVSDLHGVATGLYRHVRPGGLVLLCLMGRYVPWEWGWFLWKGDRKAAFRRLAAGGTEWRGLRIAYPSIRGIRRTFAPGFRFLGARAIGVFVPPSYVEEWAATRPHLLSALDALERRLEAVPPFPSLADHVLVELERL
jgi:SAM-dependent methyltransferase